ncbi:MAG: recombination protein RecR [Armatimonadetes bacterium]|nr:recombination protein RecR [Armatimonadota bacterium]
MLHYAQPIARLISELSKMPTVGPKTAQRLALHIVKMSQESVNQLISAIQEVKEKIRRCSLCNNLADRDPCLVCSDPERDRSTVCVVAEPKDAAAIERSRGFKGMYHVLGGVLSPLDGIGPENLSISLLLKRMEEGTITEVILATNPTVEGDATALYLGKLLQPLGPKVSRLARGLPTGADLDYADEITLARSLEGRRDL